MPFSPSVGVFIPGPGLNACNSASPTGQQDAQGNNIASGLTAGKMIFLGPNEAESNAAPGTTLYDGAYQWVQLDSNATNTNCEAGMAAYIVVDSTASAANNRNLKVTDYSHALAPGMMAGVFINPATYKGNDNKVTPGNWCFIFVGAGAVQVNIDTATGTAIGDTVDNNEGSGSGFVSNASTTTTTAATLGIALTKPSTLAGAVVWVKNILYRFAN